MTKRWKIEDLLASGVQPFEDLDRETLKLMGQNITKAGFLAVPIVITQDGVLVDGFQRVQAMSAWGRKELTEDDVRIIPISRDQAWEYSVKLNVQRRHLTKEQKRAKALELQTKLHWSRSKIAECFGVSRAAVSQWLAGDPQPEHVVGKDGVIQRPAGDTKSAFGGRPLVDGWQADGPVLKLVVKLNKEFSEMLDNRGENQDSTRRELPDRRSLGDEQFDFVLITLKELQRHIDNVLAITNANATPTKKAARPK